MHFLSYYTLLHTLVKFKIKLMKVNIFFVSSDNGELFNILALSMLGVIYVDVMLRNFIYCKKSTQNGAPISNSK